MLRHRAARGSHADAPALLRTFVGRCDLLCGARVTGEPLTVSRSFTRTHSHPTGWTGFSRRIDREMLADVAFAPSQQPLCMVCGPTPLVEAVARSWSTRVICRIASRPSDSGRQEGNGMDETQLRLDGNAAAGVLRNLFVDELTTARGACAGGGAIAQIGTQHLYMQTLSPVVSCVATPVRECSWCSFRLRDAIALVCKASSGSMWSNPRRQAECCMAKGSARLD